MFFSQEAMEEMAGSYGSMDERAEALVVAFASFDFKNDRAREFATHGFSRRIRTLTRCIENVFNRLPPDDDAIPTTEACVDAAAYVQAFLFNVFGALDNLAWTWVQEKDIKNQHGGELKETRVGLGKKYRDIRRTFSPQFRKYLDGHQDWFKHLADFRHALAHRIPLYIPRYAIVDHAKYADLQAHKEAVVGDPREFDRLTQEQMKHVQFQPVMVHSFSEKSPRIVFHPQILSDFAMVEEIGQKMLVELSRDVPAQRVSGPGLHGREIRTVHADGNTGVAYDRDGTRRIRGQHPDGCERLGRGKVASRKSPPKVDDRLRERTRARKVGGFRQVVPNHHDQYVDGYRGRPELALKYRGHEIDLHKTELRSLGRG